MGILGAPLSVPLGGHEEMIAFLEIRNVTGGVRVRFQPATNYGQNFQLEIDGVAAGFPVYASEDEITELRGAYNAPGTSHVVCVVPMGDVSANDYDNSYQGIAFQEERSASLHAILTTTPRIVSTGVTGQLSAWALTGVKRFANCRPFIRRPSWGVMDVAIVKVTTTITVTLSCRGITLAEGSRTGNGSITLAAQNGSGINGTVSVTYTADVSTGGMVCVEFPAQLAMHYKTGAFSGGDFPRTAENYVFDDGYSNVFNYRSPALAASTYHLLSHQIDPQGNESTGTASTAVVVNGPPQAPTALTYVSGGATGPATTISWVASTTLGATYEYFDSGDTGILDIETVAGTHIAGVGTLTQLLAAIDPGFTGVRQVVVRAVNGSVDDGNADALQIEYLAGVVVLKRPPVPGSGNNITTNGLTLTVPYIIDSDDQKTPTTHVLLYVWDENGGSPSYGTPQTSDPIGTVEAGNTTVGTISYTVSGEGSYKYAVRTYSMVTLTESDNLDTAGPVFLTTTPMTDASVAELYAGL